ncbi:MAG: hypothetical protein FWF67_02610 [Fibromonadales bacterium]|nr:hypothetical protein [Fibromonadales bacterium]
MAFFVPFVLGAAAAAAGFQALKQYNNRKNGECTCGCGDECKCEPDCDCGCNSSLKKKVAEKADIALDKIKSGLQVLENNINESTLEKVRSGLQTAESKIAALQQKLKEEKSSADK